MMSRVDVPQQTLGLIEDSMKYNALLRKLAVEKHMRATPLPYDLARLVVKYTQPAKNILDRIDNKIFSHEVPISVYSIDGDTYTSIISIETIFEQRNCYSCSASGYHLCARWILSNKCRFWSDVDLCRVDIWLNDIFLQMYTGNVRSLLPALFSEGYRQDDFHKSMSDERYESLMKSRIEIATAALQAFIDELIW